MLLRRHKILNVQEPTKTAPKVDNKIATGQVAADHIIPPQTDEKKTYTKTEINRLSTAELQTLALENGIDGADGMTGNDLKKILIEKFGL